MSKLGPKNSKSKFKKGLKQRGRTNMYQKPFCKKLQYTYTIASN